MCDITQIAIRVKKAIVQSLQLNIKADDIADDESVFEGVGADSIAALEIVFALEKEFGIEVDDEDLRVELFDSVSAMSRYVAEKLQEGKAYTAP